MPDTDDQLNGVTLRPLDRADFVLLTEWINMPHVARWWDGAATIESVSSKYEPRLKSDSATKVYVIQASGRAEGDQSTYQWDIKLKID